MADVFISYKRRLRPRVEALAARLREHGFDVWFDASLNAGESFSDEISRQVRAAKCVLVCWTNDCFPHGRAANTADEGWVRQEAHIGLTRGVLVPVFAEPTDLDPPFRNLQTEDLTHWLRDAGVGSDDDRTWRHVLDAVATKTGRRVAPPQPAHIPPPAMRPDPAYTAPASTYEPAAPRKGLPLAALGTAAAAVLLAVILGYYVAATRGWFAPTETRTRAGCNDAAACAFVETILASTQNVWARQAEVGRLPHYANAPLASYNTPPLVFFDGQTSTACGTASSGVGPFFCPADATLYVDPSYYNAVASQSSAAGDFTQAYLLAHEIGHQMQTLIGATAMQMPGEAPDQTASRIELQAACFAGVWAHSAMPTLAISDEDLAQAMYITHAITITTAAPLETPAQRMRWFRRGFDSGDARQCDTFAVSNYGQL